MSQNIKIAFIADIHYGSDFGTKSGVNAYKTFEVAKKEIEKQNPDLIIDMGDRISDEDPVKDIELLSTVSNWYNELPQPKRFLFGNHDLRYIDHEKGSKILGCKTGSWLEDINDDYQFLYWNPKIKYIEDQGFHLLSKELDFFQNLLNEATKNIIIFSHFPLDCRPTKGNYYFDSTFEKLAFIQPQEKIQAIIEKSEKVVACINGHMHWNNIETIDGIHYITIPSLTDSYMCYPEPLGAFGIMNINKDTIELEIFGKQPIYYRLQINDPKHHWVRMEKTDYAPYKEYGSK